MSNAPALCHFTRALHLTCMGCWRGRGSHRAMWWLHGGVYPHEMPSDHVSRQRIWMPMGAQGVCAWRWLGLSWPRGSGFPPSLLSTSRPLWWHREQGRKGMKNELDTCHSPLGRTQLQPSQLLCLQLCCFCFPEPRCPVLFKACPPSQLLC